MALALMAHGALALATPSTAPRVPKCGSLASLVWIESGAAVVAAPSSALAAAPSERPAPPRSARARRPVVRASHDEHAAPASHAVDVPPSTPIAAPMTHAASSNEAAPGRVSVRAHGPLLLPTASSCASHFPRRARVDHGEVQVWVDVDAAGHARVVDVVAEFPNGQGFDAAARSCAENLRFDPAVDDRGARIVGHAKLRLRFDRRQA